MMHDICINIIRIDLCSNNNVSCFILVRLTRTRTEHTTWKPVRLGRIGQAWSVLTNPKRSVPE